MKILTIKNLNKRYQDKILFEDFSMEVNEHEFLSITGASGSGKSTLLNMIGLLEKPDSGDIEMFGEHNSKPFTRKSEKILKSEIGYLFQNFALIDNETVMYNMLLAIENQKINNKKEVVLSVLKEFGLDGIAEKKIYKCSGGEQQRISIARLLIKPCNLILADEPTGSLDRENKHIVFDLLLKLKEAGKTLIVVTHDEELVQLADRCIKIS